MSLDFDEILEKYLPTNELNQLKLSIYGRADDQTIDIPNKALNIADRNNFQIKGFAFGSNEDIQQKPRIVRIAGVQNSIVLPTSDPVDQQIRAIHNKVAKIIEAASICHVNVLCLQELWTMPFGLCTGESTWCEFAEDAETGLTTAFLSNFARQHNMVIISPILERDTVHNDIIWNTVVVISNSGKYMGKHRKNHIPISYECKYYCPGNTGHQVFDTEFGRIGINICFGRQHVMNWLMFGLNGAEIVFNTAGTTMPISGLWTQQAQNAAFANSYFTLAINRVGTEHFSSKFTTGSGKMSRNSFGSFYGSSYIAAPDGTRSPALSSHMDGLLIGEIDLNMCNDAKDRFKFYENRRLSFYAKKLSNVARFDYEPELIKNEK